MTLPIGHIVPLANENRWSDLLAVLIESDPGRVAPLLGLGELPHRVRARREDRATGRDRIDLLLDVDGQLRSVVEVKVLSGLATDQLRRYRAAFPDAGHHIVVFPGPLTIDLAESGWRGVTWEELLGAFTASGRPWVAETAHAWLVP